MKDIKVRGPGCARCATTVDMVEAKKLGIEVYVEKAGVVIDGKIVHAGGLPKSADLATWLQG